MLQGLLGTKRPVFLNAWIIAGDKPDFVITRTMVSVYIRSGIG
jgi:hypothetical protein